MLLKTLFTSETFSLLGQCCGGRLNGPDEGEIVSPDPDKKQGILLPILYVHNLYVLPCSEKDRANACSCDTGFPSYHNFVSVLAGCPARNHFDTHVAFFANQL